MATSRTLAPRFFLLIIGTEILNQRRKDKHFDFIAKALSDKGHKLTASFIIEDDPALIVQTLKFIASQENPILFSFGGIGSTPDDHTRKCAAIALKNGLFEVHAEAKEMIEEKLGQDAYPHPIRMAELPKGAQLIENPINGMPGFSLDKKYFFVPGFPEMGHPMIKGIIEAIIPDKKNFYRYTLTAACKENMFIEIMEKMPKDVEFSSLPKRIEKGWEVSISVASYSQDSAKKSFQLYLDLLETKQISYSIDT